MLATLQLISIAVLSTTQPAPIADTDLISFTTPGMRLVRIVDQYNAKYGTMLTVQKSMGEEVLSVNARDLTRREFLDSIAAVTYGQWKESALIEDTFRIAAKVKTQQAERLRLNGEMIANFKNFVKNKPSYDPKDIKAVLGSGTPVAADGSPNRNGFDAKEYEKYLKFQAALPETNMIEYIFTQLTAAQLLKCTENSRLVLSTKPNKFQSQLTFDPTSMIKDYQKNQETFLKGAEGIKINEDDWSQYQLTNSINQAKRATDLSKADEVVIIINGQMTLDFAWFSATVQVLDKKNKVLLSISGDTQLKSPEETIADYQKLMSNSEILASGEDDLSGKEPFIYKPSALSRKFRTAGQAKWLFQNSEDTPDITAQKEFNGLIYNPDINDPLALLDGDVLQKSAEYGGSNRFVLLTEESVFGQPAEIRLPVIKAALKSSFEKLDSSKPDTELYSVIDIKTLRQRTNRPGLRDFTNALASNNRVMQLKHKLIFASAAPTGQTFSSLASTYSGLFSPPTFFDLDGYWYFSLQNLKLLSRILESKPDFLKDGTEIEFSKMNPGVQTYILQMLVNGQLSGSSPVDFDELEPPTFSDGESGESAEEQNSVSNFFYQQPTETTSFLDQGVPGNSKINVNAETKKVLIAISAKSSIPICVSPSQLGSMFGSADNPEFMRFYGSIKDYQKFQIAEKVSYTVTLSWPLFSSTLGTFTDIVYDKNSAFYKIETLPADLQKELLDATKNANEVIDPDEVTPELHFGQLSQSAK